MIATLVVLAGLAAALATAASFARDWRLALLSHFRPHLAVACGALALLVLIAGLPAEPKLALAALLVVCAVIHGRAVWRATPPARATAGGGGERMRLAAANVLRSNTNRQGVIDWVRREQVDVFVAAEAVRGWRTALMALADELPHVAGHPSGDVMIFSRHPFDGEPRHFFPDVGYAVAVEVAGLAVIGVHTASPEDVNHDRACNELIAMVGEAVRATPGPVVAAGDFNATPWSAPIVELVDRTGLAHGPNARRGSFPAAWAGVNVPTWLALPIDLVLAGHGARVAEHRHGPRLGSDHWPAVADIQYSRRLDPPDPRP